MAVWVAPMIAGIASLASAYMGRNAMKNQPPPSPDYEWIKKHGPGMWNKLKGEATNLMDNPYGLTQDIRNRMYSTARNTAEAGYGAAMRGSDRTAALSGLSPGGGDATRRGYYAGQQMAEGLNSAYSGIDIQDFMAKEEQKNRGTNLMFSLSNKSPVYSQIAAQNYWNSLNASRESAAQNGALYGGIAGNLTEGLMNAYDTGNPYGGNTNSYGYDNNMYGPTQAQAAPAPTQYNPYDEFGGQ